MKSLRRPRRAPVLLLDGDRAGAGRRSPARVTVSVISVNWNAGQALAACLASLAAGGVPAPEVVLVGNASSDGSARAASARHPQVRLVETGANPGFAAGANRGAEAARGDVLVFLNPDARVLPGALATLVEALARTPGAGIAGGGLTGEGGRGGEGGDALLRRARRPRRAQGLPRRGGVQVRPQDGARRGPRPARRGRDLRPGGARLPHLRSGRLVSELVTLAVPCRSDEPALGRTLAAALASWRRAPASATHGLEVLVCLNGADGPRPRADLLAFARDAGAPLAEMDLERGDGAASAPPASALTVAALVTRRAGKPIAWNALRERARGTLALFVDADVSFGSEAFGLLLGVLTASPQAALASAKTTCAPRAGLFEGIMTAPYGVDFPNLSPQLYAARVAALPPAMPEDLIEPERWLELVLGCNRIVRVPAARVAVRLPGTLPDFFRQRIRIEMGKVQLARQYPELAARGAPQPRARAALGSLGPGGLLRVAAYLGLRSAAHAVAWWRYRRGATAGIWRQAATTKRWDAA